MHMVTVMATVVIREDNPTRHGLVPKRVRELARSENDM